MATSIIKANQHKLTLEIVDECGKTVFIKDDISNILVTSTDGHEFIEKANKEYNNANSDF